MQPTRTTTLRLLRIACAALLIAVIIGYAIWRSLDYARGPVIEITEPTNGSSVNSLTTTIKGRADRVNNLILNGNPIVVDEKGAFSETIAVFPGLNKITLAAHDQFGRSTAKELEIVGTAPFPSTDLKL